MKISVLVDNNTFIDQYYLGEPALSFMIEENNQMILFDTGYSNVVIENAKKMNFDLQKINYLVLSHGHNDHTNGLQYILPEIKNKTKLITHPDVFQKKFLNGEYIGTPLSIEEISNQFDLIMTKKPYKLTEKLIYLGEIPRLTSFEAQNPIGKQEIQGLLEDDYIVDDSALVYHAKNGLFIITGCSHSGICNIIEYAKKVCHEDRIVGIIGGFHLLKDDEQLNQTIEYFKQCHIKTLYPCHCVSLQAKAQMMQQLHIEEVGVGLQIDVE